MTDPFSYRIDRPSKAGQALPEAGAADRAGSLDDLARRLEARQRERESRYHGAPQPDQTQAPGAPAEQPMQSDEEQPEASAAGDLGGRFGWEERWAEDEVRRYFDEQDAPEPRRWGGLLLRAGGVLAVSAVIAFFIVFPGGTPEQTAGNGNGALVTAAGEGAASAESPVSAANDATPDRTPDDEAEAITTTATIPSAPQPARDAEATSTTASAPSAPDTSTRQAAAAGDRSQTSRTSGMVASEGMAFGNDGVRTVVPAPQQTQADTEYTPSDAASVDGGADEAGMLRSSAPQTSWIAPGPQAESGDGAPADAAGEVAARADDAVEAGEDARRAIGDDAPPAEEPAPAAADGQPAQVTSDVNLRDQPDNEGTVLAVIPANATVELLGCEIWCEVVHDGRQGWVYRDFVTGAEQAASAQ